MRKHLLAALCVTAPALMLASCATGYGAGAYGGSPYAYDGFYDDFYGPIYDGYWGDDQQFYFRRSARDRHFQRGDSAHFSRSGSAAGRFHPMQGAMTPSRGMRMPHFGAGAHNGGREHRPR